MARRSLQLSPEATALIGQVSSLEERLTVLSQEFAVNVARVRAEVEKEVGRVETARLAALGVPEAQATRLARETDRMAAELDRADSTILRANSNPAPKPRNLLGTGDVFPAGDHAELEGLSERRTEVAMALERLAVEREGLAQERDRLLAEVSRKLNADRQRLAMEIDQIRIKNERESRADRDRLKAEEAAATARLDQDRAAFDAAVRTKRYELSELVAKAWADYELAVAKAQADALEFKPHPALRAANEVRTKGHDLAAARRAAKQAEWVIAFYEQQFPWLSELRDLEAEDDYVVGDQLGREASDEDQEVDPGRKWLSSEEWEKLPVVERYQRALDRYLRSNKAPWQLGRDYERYIGYLRERDGARVFYQGIFKGLEDLGRDLLCETSQGIEVVQCKRWAQHKTIHEKHVFQLFGTMVALRIEQPDVQVTGTFVTTTRLSDRARRFAVELGIRVEEKTALEHYPRIKCNVARDGEQIYHLPFDQQYDATLIEPHKGECWVESVAEAEELGFRRAWRWQAPGASST